MSHDVLDKHTGFWLVVVGEDALTAVQTYRSISRDAADHIAAVYNESVFAGENRAMVIPELHEGKP